MLHLNNAAMVHQIPPAHLQTHPNPPDVAATWRKMYAHLIHYYESNGHSRVDPSTHPRLASWLSGQRQNYANKLLTPGQEQQLRLMKVHFIDGKGCELGTKCQFETCVKFGAFEGYCHEHYHVSKRKAELTTAEVNALVDPDGKKRKQVEISNESAVVSKRPMLSHDRQKVSGDQTGETDSAALPSDQINETYNQNNSASSFNKECNSAAVTVTDKINQNESALTANSTNPADTVTDSNATAKGSCTKLMPETPKATDAASEENQIPKTVNDKRAWLKQYGLLILYYEEYGHSNVTLQSSSHLAPPSLVTWVNLQRERYKKGMLSHDEVSRLSLLGFGQDHAHGIVGTVQQERCVEEDCEKFAVFNGRCHAHFTQKGSKRVTAEAQSYSLPKKTTAAILNPMHTAQPIDNHTPNEQAANVSNRNEPETRHPKTPMNSKPTPKRSTKTPSLQNKHNQNIWHKHYGSLILFYEQYGHTKVNLLFSRNLAPPSLITWVNLQRERYKTGKLNEDEIKRLDLLGFRNDHIDKDKSAEQSKRCGHENCSKFAAFDGKCHAHFSQVDNSNAKLSNRQVHGWLHHGLQKKLKSRTIGESFVFPRTTPAAQNLDNTGAQDIVYIPPRVPAQSIFPGNVGVQNMYIPQRVPARTENTTQKPKARKKAIKKRATKAKFPIIGFSKQSNGLWTLAESEDNGTPNNKKIKDLTNEQVIYKLSQYVSALSTSENCSNCREYYTQCTCLHYLRDKPFAVEAVSRAIFDYCQMPAPQRKRYALERMRMAGSPNDRRQVENNSLLFTLPLSYEYVDNVSLPEVDGQSRESQISSLFKHRICISSWHNLHNIGRRMEETLLKYLNGDTSVTRHKSTGNRYGIKDRARENARQFLEALYSEHLNLDNCATGEVVGDKQVIVLPREYSKKILWRKFMREQGWIIEVLDRKKQKIAKVKDWILVPGFYATQEEATCNEGKAAGQKITNAVFGRLWNDEFPFMKVVEGQMKGGSFLHQREHVQNLLRSLQDEYALDLNDPNEIVHIPFSKKSVYFSFIREQGWLVQEKNGKMPTYQGWKLLDGFYATEEEAKMNNGKVAGKKISYPSFYNIWRDDFPRLRVSKGKAPVSYGSEDDYD